MEAVSSADAVYCGSSSAIATPAERVPAMLAAHDAQNDSCSVFRLPPPAPVMRLHPAINDDGGGDAQRTRDSLQADDERDV